MSTPADIFLTAGPNSGYYVASSAGNTASQWNDISGNGNNLTQPTSGDRLSIGSGLNGITCYRSVPRADSQGFVFPSIAFDKQASALWCIYRPVNMPFNNALPFKGVNCIVQLGSGATDYLLDFCPSPTSDVTPNKIQLTSSGGVQVGSFGRTDLSVLILSAGPSSAIVRLDGLQTTLSAMSSGTVTGGTLGYRQDGYSFDGELYEFGIIDRTLTGPEISMLESYAQTQYKHGSFPTYGQVVIDGDSLSDGTGSSTFLGWTNVLNNNVGLSYKQVSQALNNNTIQTTATHATKTATLFDGTLTRNIAVCWLGTNDVVGSGRTSTQVLGDLQTWATAFKMAGFQTVLCTMINRGDLSGAQQTTRTALNAGITGLSNVDFVADFAGISQLVAADPNSSIYYYDGIHLTDAGYALIEYLIRSYIQPTFRHSSVGTRTGIRQAA